jgi:hypothetical protein
MSDQYELELDGVLNTGKEFSYINYFFSYLHLLLYAFAVSVGSTT